MDSEALLRLGAFFGVLGPLLAWEAFAPNRPRIQARWIRWPTHLLLSAINTAFLRVLAPGVTLLTALWAERHGIGLLPLLQPDPILASVAAFLLLDFIIYLQHLAMHHVPLLWSMHQVHHADRDMDATTAIRFHPFEMVTSLALKIAAILALGAPASAVLAFEIMLNATAMFSHANIRLPRLMDTVLRWLIVTPDMHLVHHSTLRHETDSNFGFNLSLWDRLFGTYRTAAQGGVDGQTVGIAAFQSHEPGRLSWCLALPWRHKG